jgi:hypothetical protein
MPVAALAQVHTGITATQSLFTGTIPKAASLVAIMIGGYAFAQRRDFRGFYACPFLLPIRLVFPTCPLAWLSRLTRGFRPDNGVTDCA